MKKLFFGLVLFSLVVMNWGVVQAQNEVLFSLGEVSLVRIGTRIYTLNEKTVQEPIFAVRIGDTSQAEARSAFWGKFFAEYAMNATLYVRVKAGENENWRAMTYRRPSSPEEVEKFIADPPESFKQFYGEKIVKKDELPLSLVKLEPKEFSCIDFVLVYLGGGGTKIYLNYGITFEDTRKFTEKIAELVK